MTAQIHSVDYTHEGDALEGSLAWDGSATGERPCILIAHDAMKSRAGFEQDRALQLARMGYCAFVLDLYGKGVHGAQPEDALPLMKPFQEDRALLARRMAAGLEAARRQPEVDATRLAAIGYCFGGLCVLDLARSAAPVQGVASFHGILSPPDPASDFVASERIPARVLVLHGWDDPYVPPEQVEAFASEMTRAEADWQLLAFGRTLHGFSNPNANRPETGSAWEPKADRRSWRALEGFLEELFPDELLPE
ncbi:MAG: dienelactone hydrolase family protein [bacterium]